MILGFGPVIQKLFRHERRKLDSVLFFRCFDEFCCMTNGNEFFFICGSGCMLMFPNIALLLKRLHLGSESVFIMNGMILMFFVGMCILSLSSYLHALNYTRISHMSFLFDDLRTFKTMVSGFLWSVVSMCPYLLALRLSSIDWWALSVPSKITSFACSPFFPGK